MSIEDIPIKDATGVSRGVASDVVDGKFVQVIKVGFGPDGALSIVGDGPDGTPLPVTMPDITTLNQEATQLALVNALSGEIPVHPSQAGDVATELTDGRKIVAAPGSPEALAADATPCKWVIATALKTNSQDVWIGGAGVSGVAGAEAGTPLAPGDDTTIPVDDVAKVFVDPLVAGEGVTYTVGS